MENIIENKIAKIIAILKDESVSNVEKINYRKILSKLCLKHKIDMNLILNKKDENRDRFISILNNDEEDILVQCVFKVIGHKENPIKTTKPQYKERFVFFNCNDVDYLEINELVDFCLSTYRREKKILSDSIIYKYDLFSNKVTNNNEESGNKLTDYEISRIVENMSILPDKNLKLN